MNHLDDSWGNQTAAESLFDSGEEGGPEFDVDRFLPNVASFRAKRAVKMEIQVAGNRVFRVRKSGSRKLLSRKFGPPSNEYLYKGKRGRQAKKGKEGTAIELQSEAGGFLEFETPKWFTSWCSLKKRIAEAVEITREIQQPANLIRTVGSTKVYRFPYDTKHLRRKKHFSKGLRKGETLEVEVKDPHFRAKIQFSEKMRLTQYHGYMRQHLGSSVATKIQTQALRIIRKANIQKLPLKSSGNLANLMQIILTYLWSIEHTNKQRESGRVKKKPLAKEHIFLMSRTNLSSIFRTLLSKDEKSVYSAIVDRKVLLDELGLSAKAPVFRLGYKGRLPRRSGLRGKQRLTVHYWLISIKKRKRDLLARIGGDNRAMGRFEVPGSTRKDRFLIRFETRGRIERPSSLDRLVQPAKRWVAFAKHNFEISHRRRSNPLSSLTFKPKKCP